MKDNILQSFIGEIVKIAERGAGMGVGGPRQGLGRPESCKCPSCGTAVGKTPGIPCNLKKCPKCGTPLTASDK